MVSNLGVGGSAYLGKRFFHRHCFFMILFFLVWFWILEFLEIVDYGQGINIRFLRKIVFPRVCWRPHVDAKFNKNRTFWIFLHEGKWGFPCLKDKYYVGFQSLYAKFAKNDIFWKKTRWLMFWVKWKKVIRDDRSMSKKCFLKMCHFGIPREYNTQNHRNRRFPWWKKNTFFSRIRNLNKKSKKSDHSKIEITPELTISIFC